MSPFTATGLPSALKSLEAEVTLPPCEVESPSRITPLPSLFFMIKPLETIKIRRYPRLENPSRNITFCISIGRKKWLVIAPKSLSVTPISTLFDKILTKTSHRIMYEILKETY